MSNPNLYLCANYNLNFCVYTSLSFYFKCIDLNRLIYLGIQGLSTLMVLESHDFSASVTATQVNLMASPLCCVNIYRCHF